MNEKEIEIHRGRQQVYLALAQAFIAPPTAEMLANLDIADPTPIHPPVPQSGFARGLTLVRDSQQSLAGEPGRVLSALMLDYSRLFVGPGDVLAPPWESVYRTEEHLVFGHSTLDVRVFFRKHGLAVPNMNQEPDDHLGLELAFMSVLAERTADAYAGASSADVSDLIQEQQRFLREHLGQWIGAFASRVTQFAQTPFYQGLAIIVQDFIQKEIGWLREVSR